MPGEGPAGVLFDLPGVTQRDYDSLMQSLDIGSAPPEGALFHLAGPHPDGGWLIVSVWESLHAFERFANERLLPAARALGVTPVRPRIFPVYELLARNTMLGQAEFGSTFSDAVVALAGRHARSGDPR